METVFVCVRHDVPWDDEQAFRAQLKPSFAPKVAAWNATFRMPFRVFRAEVRDVARENLARVEGVERRAWQDLPEGAIALPVDDDDWLSPDAARVIAAAAEQGVEAWTWPHTALEVPIDFWHRLELLRRRLVPSTPLRWTCSTKDYALRRRDGRDHLFHDHRATSAWVDGEAIAESLGRRISVQNRTLGSITQMGFGRSRVSPRELRRKLHEYRRLYDRFAPSSPELEWMAPHVRRMADLVSRVGER
ncbi:MAG: hypothetical protein ACKPBU_16940 [Alphaproteobacteria bacterium]